MRLLSIFERRADAAPQPGPGGDAVGAVQRARTRARQRLIGEVVLVGIGVIVFPLVFETQPRPIPVDIPIEIPRRDNAPALVMPAARAPDVEAASSPSSTLPSPATPAAMVSPKAAAAPNDLLAESRQDAGRELAPPLGSASQAAATAQAASKPSVVVTSVAPLNGAATTTPVADGLRAQALLEGKSGPATVDGRYVVQVGAFADANAAHETRLKVEKLGLKTYTQVASTAGGNRIRVRVGPFGSREEADKALAKARGAGLAAVVLTL